MAVIKVSDLPQKSTLDSDDKIVGYSSTGGTSLLPGSAFTAIQTAAETAATKAAASESSVSSQKAELESEIATAKTDIVTAQTDAVSAVQEAQSTAETAITTDQTTAVSAVNSAKSTALSDISTQQASSVASVKSQGDTSVTAVQSAQSAAETAITTAQSTAVTAVQSQEAASIQAIEVDSVLAGYAKKGDLSSAQSDLASQISSKQDASTAVTLDGVQTITGAKTFSSTVTATGNVVSSGVIKGTQFTAVNGGNKNIDFFAYGYPIVTSTLAGGWSLVDGTFPSGGWAQILTNYGDQSCTGTMRAAAFVQTSDERKKAGLTPIHPDLSSLTAYRYTLEADGKTHVGLVAQEVEKVIPEAVVEDKEGFLALDYSAVVTALVDEVNRLRKRVEALEGVGEN